MPGLLDDPNYQDDQTVLMGLLRRFPSLMNIPVAGGQQPIAGATLQPQAPATTTPAPQPAIAPTEATDETGVLGLLGKSQANQKNKWMMPVGLGLLNMGANMAGPYRPAVDAPPWARGVQGLGQGLMQGIQVQKAQQDEALKNIKSALEIKKAFAQPEEVTVGGVKFAKDQAGKLTRLDSKANQTAIERYAQTQGISVEEAEERIAAAKARGKVSETPQEKTAVERYARENNLTLPEAEAAITAAKEKAKVVSGSKWKPEFFFNPKTGKGAWIKPGEMPAEGYIPGKAGMSNITTEDDIKTTVQGVLEGDIPPSMLSKRNTKGEYTKILAEVQRQGGSMGKLENQYQSAKKLTQSLNSQQMVRFQGLANSVVGTIDEVGALSEELKQSGISPLNKLNLEAKIKLAGNTPQGQLATRYVTAVNTLKEEFANLAQGGYAPTEAVWALANRQINENFGVDQMKASLTEIKRLINYRIHAFEELKPMMPQGGKPGQQSAGSGSKELSPQERQAYDQKMTQIQALPDGPQKQQALKQMQDLAAKWGIK